jgi:hypothetical protein
MKERFGTAASDLTARNESAPHCGRLDFTGADHSGSFEAI